MEVSVLARTTVKMEAGEELATAVRELVEERRRVEELRTCPERLKARTVRQKSLPQWVGYFQVCCAVCCPQKPTDRLFSRLP